HMLCEKQRHGPGFALNRNQLAKKRADGGLGISKRAFTAGIRLLRSSGLLKRWQGGPRKGGGSGGAFAREELASGSSRYVPMNENLILEGSSKLVAFVAAVLLNPHPATAAAVARRIGLKDRAAIGNL